MLILSPEATVYSRFRVAAIKTFEKESKKISHTYSISWKYCIFYSISIRCTTMWGLYYASEKVHTNALSAKGSIHIHSIKVVAEIIYIIISTETIYLEGYGWSIKMFTPHNLFCMSIILYRRFISDQEPLLPVTGAITGRCVNSP